jgi:hypothetical protein
MMPPISSKLIGHRFGRLTVIGLLAERKWSPAHWVCRCDCGDYELRRTAEIWSPASGNDRCRVCLHSLKVADDYKRLGSRSIDDFLNPPAVIDEEAERVAQEAERAVRAAAAKVRWAEFDERKRQSKRNRPSHTGLLMYGAMLNWSPDE